MRYTLLPNIIIGGLGRRDHSLCHREPRQWRIQTPPPPTDQKVSQFHAVFLENWQFYMLAPRPGGSPPPPRRILDPPLSSSGPNYLNSHAVFGINLPKNRLASFVWENLNPPLNYHTKHDRSYI